ncbi:hypothetical protein Spb1_20290 [Planctopirus ephydatiae]|uniref:Uncharacterized protein n=1 Tax=Planctopirus ephydatiae TaxID=2528019 RepID=A0A518GNS1_9PLAN|nr:hypothetical protein [Planctopirus ephydatiae]QDV30101.1 hypothetical protein Spb1_20290 [Planctopirus ephydatiae]
MKLQPTELTPLEIAEWRAEDLGQCANWLDNPEDWELVSRNDFLRGKSLWFLNVPAVHAFGIQSFLLLGGSAQFIFLPYEENEYHIYVRYNFCRLAIQGAKASETLELKWDESKLNPRTVVINISNQNVSHATLDLSSRDGAAIWTRDGVWNGKLLKIKGLPYTDAFLIIQALQAGRRALFFAEEPIDQGAYFDCTPISRYYTFPST